MTTGTICEPAMKALVPSPEDVAHYFAMIWAREGERSMQTLQSLANAYAGQQVLDGKPEPAVTPFFPAP